jgi:hypothetical protein
MPQPHDRYSRCIHPGREARGRRCLSAYILEQGGQRSLLLVSAAEPPSRWYTGGLGNHLGHPQGAPGPKSEGWGVSEPCYLPYRLVYSMISEHTF